MPMYCRYFSFCAPPKTGCQYMRDIIRGLRKPGEPGESAATLHIPGIVEGIPSVSTVRDPCDWLRSYFQNIITPLNQEPVDKFLAYGSPDRKYNRYSMDHLRKFVQDYLNGPSGLIYSMFMHYPAEHRFRLEDMPEPLEDLLGREVPQASHHRTHNRMGFPEDLRPLVYQHEPALCAEFDYPIEVTPQ